MESGWVKVRNRRRENGGESWASRIKEAATLKGVSPLKGDSIGSKAVTFYITNFPEIWSKDEIWKTLRSARSIVDLFIAKRRNAIGRMFGFAKFFGVKDVKGCEERLNAIWMKKLKLKANIARFGRKEGKSNIRALVGAPRKLKSVVVQKEVHGQSSYAGILSGSSEETKKDVSDQPNAVDPIPKVSIMLPHAAKEVMKKKLIGRLKDFAKLRGIQNSLAAEGWSDVICRYLGSFYVLLVFKDEKVALVAMVLYVGGMERSIQGAG